MSCIYSALGLDLTPDGKLGFYICCKRKEFFYKVDFDEVKDKDMYEVCKEVWRMKVDEKYKSPYYCGYNYTCDWSDDTLERLRVSISDRCNQSCNFCSIKKGALPKEIGKDFYFKILDDLAKHSDNFTDITLTDRGEPFFYKEETFNFIEKVSNNCCVNALTNLTLLSIDDARRLVKLKEQGKKISISASINGWDEETLAMSGEKIDNFEEMVMVLAILFQNKILSRMSCVITPDKIDWILRIKEEWEEIIPGISNIIKITTDFENKDNNAVKVLDAPEWKMFYPKTSIWEIPVGHMPKELIPKYIS